MARVAKESSHIRVRVETPLLARLEKAAEKNGRTLTGEITHRLEESFKRDDTVDTFNRLADELSEKMTVKFGDMIRKQGRWVREGDDK